MQYDKWPHGFGDRNGLIEFGRKTLCILRDSSCAMGENNAQWYVHLRPHLDWMIPSR